MVQKYAPRRQQRHASRRTLEEWRSDLVLQSSNLPADRRLRDVEPLGGAPHVPFFGNSNKISDLRKAHTPMVP